MDWKLGGLIVAGLFAMPAAYAAESGTNPFVDGYAAAPECMAAIDAVYAKSASKDEKQGALACSSYVYGFLNATHAADKYTSEGVPLCFPSSWNLNALMRTASKFAGDMRAKPNPPEMTYAQALLAATIIMYPCPVSGG